MHMVDKKTPKPISRRTFIGATGGAVAAASLAGCAALSPVADPTAISTSRKRALRIAHLTDVHVTGDKGAPDGFAACLRHAHSLADRPDIILNGGDCIMDALNARADWVGEQWSLWQAGLRDHCTLPIHHCIGNHDVWGWNRESSQTTGQEPLYGKEWARQVFNLDQLYRSFDLNGWHFIILDSNMYDGGTAYLAKFDDEQFAWLERDLAATDPAMPVLVLTHIPILSACVFYDGDNAKADWVVPRAWMHIDSPRVNDLFNQHPNIKVCLSGHLHLYEQVLYNGVTYICNGAVCGNWWEGSYKQTPPGYGLVDIYDDGTVHNEYITLSNV